MKKSAVVLLVLARLCALAQIDTVIPTLKATLLFPGLPVKSSFTNLLDRNNQAYLYSANMESGLGIYNVSNINAISPVLDLPISGFDNLDVATVKQYGNLLYVGIGDFQVNNNTKSGLAILNVSNPASPVLMDLWDSTLFKHGVSHLLVQNNYAYLSTMTDGIFILNVSDPNNITYVSRLQLDLGFLAPSSNAHNARGLKFRNDTLFVCFDRGGLRMIDVTNKNNPTEAYKYINTNLNSTAAAAYNDVYLKGHYAFVSVDYCGLEILDISSIPFTTVQWYNPWGCNTTNWSGAALHTNELKTAHNDSLLFVSGGQSELFVFDISNPQTVSKKGEIAVINDSLASHGIDVLNNRISLSIIHTPFHIPPFTPFFSKTGGLKIYDYTVSYNVSGLSDQGKEDGIQLFPNPASGAIQLHSKIFVKQVKLYDCFGKLSLQVEEPGSSDKVNINLSNLPEGIYMVMINSENKLITQKIVIQH